MGEGESLLITENKVLITRWDYGNVKTLMVRRTGCISSATTPAQSTASHGTTTHPPSSPHPTTALSGALTLRSRRVPWCFMTSRSWTREGGLHSIVKTPHTPSWSPLAIRGQWCRWTKELAPLRFPRLSSLTDCTLRASPATL